MKKINIFRGDKVLWVVFFLLSIISLIAVYSSIGLHANSLDGKTPTGMFLKHFAIVAGTYVAIIVLSNINYRNFSRFALLGYFGSIALLVLTFVMVKIGGGSAADGSGAARWIRFGAFQLQPSEIAKVVLLIFVARMLTLKKESVATKEFFWSILVYIGIVVGLVVFENFSTAALIFLGCYIMMYLGGVNRKRWWLLLAVIVVGVSLYMGYKYFQYKKSVDTAIELKDESLIKRGNTWGGRIYRWLNPDPEAVTQENRARMAVARGKFFGQHVGSTIHGRLMTQAHNDFIYAVIIEETGALGGIVVFALYAIFYLRCVRLAKKCPGRFGKLTVAGIGTVIYIQALVNMGVAVGALPVTGQTLPFISYGGTAYLFLGAGVGVIQAVAVDTNRQAMAAKKGYALPEPEEELEIVESENKEL